MKEIILRFLVGGVVVSFFAALADVFKPKSFAGLLGAAPSVALATISLTVLKQGKSYAQIEARSMIVGGFAFFVYAWFVAWLLVRNKAVRQKFSALAVTSSSILLWFAVAFGCWYIALR